MFIFDIFKNDARRLRTLSVLVAGGLMLLLAGLWYVQIVSAKQLESRLLRQSYREVHEPGVRGRILDCNGKVLAENRPQYNVVLYLEDLRDQFGNEYLRLRNAYLREHPELKNRVPSKERKDLNLEADYNVVSNINYGVGRELHQTNAIDPARFRKFYQEYRHVPFQILTNLDAKQVAVFSEVLSDRPLLELETQPARSYPLHTTAAHLLGYVQRTGEMSRYLPADYEGRAGLEAAFDDQLSGQTGTNAVLVDYLGYRQPKSEVISDAHAGKDLYLTIDLSIQQAAQDALHGVRGAAVVMDVHSGDILAMVSSPAFDPNEFVSGISQARWEELDDPKQRCQLNRAIADNYAPGSTFKIITAIACLESGVLDPEETYHVPPNKEDPIHGVFVEQGYHIQDTAPPGDYKFEEAFYHSCNSYFAHYGMKAGLRKILEVAKRFHLGEKTGFPTHEETAGDVPGPDAAGKSKPLNDTPYVSIGQEVQVTPLQMAVMISAIANGGTVYWPRLVTHSVSPDGEVEELFAKGRVRDQVQLNPQHLQVIRHAMLEDTEHEGANAHGAFYSGSTPYLHDFHVAGKTGTAEVKSTALDEKRVTWFDSYAPYENPRYAVVVMVLDGGSGGGTCGPKAKDIYQAIIQREKLAGKTTLAKN